jgi:hypothetical protein
VVDGAKDRVGGSCLSRGVPRRATEEPHGKGPQLLTITSLLLDTGACNIDSRIAVARANEV